MLHIRGRLSASALAVMSLRGTRRRALQFYCFEKSQRTLIFPRAFSRTNAAPSIKALRRFIAP
jgi:hypothetical protein